MNCKELNQSIKDLESEFKSVSEDITDFSESEEMDKKKLADVIEIILISFLLLVLN